jgi:general secretion pathway protein G
MRRNIKQKGFSLIELLVAISIIAMLTSITMASLSSARWKSRDAKRLADIKNIELAVNQYYVDKGYFPKRNRAYSGIDQSGSCGTGNQAWCDLQTDLSSYLNTLPIDPLIPDASSPQFQNYRYFYDSDSGDKYQTFGLMTDLEQTDYIPEPLAENDNGAYIGLYEVGPQVGYCTSKSDNWWPGGNSVCSGGN